MAPVRLNPITLNIAHRGARSLAPENTLAAAHKAIMCGADMWELDVGMTLDRELIVVHDSTLERTSDVREIFPTRSPWRVQDFTLQEVRGLDFSSWFGREDPFGQIRAGAVSREDLKGFRGQHAPTLREALLFTQHHNWRVNVEIKDLSGTSGDACVVEMVARLIGDLAMKRQVIVSSFNHDYLERIKKTDSEIATGVLVNHPHPDPLALLHRLKAQAYHPRRTAVRHGEIAYLQEAGFAVHVWTVNDEKAMGSWIEAGANGICTDFPQVLHRIILG